MYREALQQEAAVISFLAKLDPDALQISGGAISKTRSDDGKIEIVVAEGLQVALPMAGDALNAIFHVLLMLAVRTILVSSSGTEALSCEFSLSSVAEIYAWLRGLSHCFSPSHARINATL